MDRFSFLVASICCATVGCGPVTDVNTLGVDNTLAGNGNFQPGGNFLGTGTLTASVCDAACAPMHNEQLSLSGTSGALKVRVGPTNYPAVFNGNTISWRAVISGGTCNGAGTQLGVITLTESGATGTRINASISHCNNSTQSCSCTYAMSYTRQM